MYDKDSFKEEFDEWKSNLPEEERDLVEFGQFDKSIDVLFLRRRGEIESDLLDDLRESLREEDDNVRVSTFTRPVENDLRDEVL